MSLSRPRPAADDPHAPVLVTVFLRGGADGLSLVPPVADDDYARLRPTLELAPAADRSVEDARRALDLDGFFGLHPSLEPLLPHYREGRLGIVHAVGSDDQTRSHFEAQDRMEHAGADGRPVGSGWLARLARSLERGPGLGCVALGTARPESLRGAPSVSVFESAAEHRVAPDDAAFAEALGGLYVGEDPLAAAGRDALGTLARLRDLAPSRAARDDYPDDPFGRRLAELARLIRGRVGVRLAAVDLDGWDTHFVQAEGFAERARVLAEGLAAFTGDLGDHLDRVTVVVMTEFGRRAYENGSLGTDHGRGSVLLALGAGVRGGRVVGRWPGLGRDVLEPPGDLAVTTDYRRVLGELLARRFPTVDREVVLPGLDGAGPGLF